MKKNSLQDISLWLYLFSLSMITGATVYQMMVIIPEFSRDTPHAMIAFAESNIDPRKFWTSPLLTLINLFAIIALLVNWRTPRRKWLLLSILFLALTVIVTVIYFIPRLQIMGLVDDKTSDDLRLLEITISEWIAADKMRFWLLVVPGFFFGLKAASVSSSKAEPKKRHFSTHQSSMAIQ